MKIRKGFVTNSSSSSFIIARNSKCTGEEIATNIIDNLYGAIVDDFNDSWTYNRLPYEVKDALRNKDESCAVRLVAKSLADYLWRNGSVQLGDWTLFSEEFGDDQDYLDNLIYSYGHRLGTENFKVG